MKIVKILGGLGNQMFQYAMYLGLKEAFPEEDVKIDISCFKGYSNHNGFELSKVFGVTPEVASFTDVMAVAYPYWNYRLWQVGSRILPKRKTMCVESHQGRFDATVLTVAGNRYFDGYWQDERYFKHVADIVKRTFDVPFVDDRNKKAADVIASKNTVSIHVRRGDYINHPVYRGICDKEYYRRAICKIKEVGNPEQYCFFSNDIEWCRENLLDLIPGKQIVLVDWNKGQHSWQDMMLMRLCKYNIVSNSSFSWWGAWLNMHNDSIVIAPSRWNNIPDNEFMLPESWIKIDVNLLPSFTTAEEGE